MEFCLLLARRDLKTKESNFLFLTPNYFSSESPGLCILGSPGDLGTSEVAVSAATQANKGLGGWSTRRGEGGLYRTGGRERPECGVDIRL